MSGGPKLTMSSYHLHSSILSPFLTWARGPRLLAEPGEDQRQERRAALKRNTSDITSGALFVLQPRADLASAARYPFAQIQSSRRDLFKGAPAKRLAAQAAPRCIGGLRRA